MRPSPARAVPYDPAAWLPVPDPAALPSIEDITLEAYVSPSPARAEPHDPRSWLPLPADVASLPPVDELLSESQLQLDGLDDASAVRDAAAALEAVVSPSPARAEPHDPNAWLPVPDPYLLATIPELRDTSSGASTSVADAAAANPPRTSRRIRWSALRAFLVAVLVTATALGAMHFVGGSEARVGPPNAFRVNVDFDGVVRTVATTNQHANGLMHQLGVGKLVSVRNMPGILHPGSTVVLRTRHFGTIEVDNQYVTFDSPSLTVQELLASYNVVLSGDDYVQPGLSSNLGDGQTVKIFRVGGETLQRTEGIPFTEEHQPDPNTPIGQTSVLRDGVNGEMSVTYRERIENGVTVGETVLSKVPTKQPVSRVIGDGTLADWHWDALAHCESNGRWNTIDHTGDGYDGGLGIYRGTWNAFGGREFAPNAGLATREQQIIVGMRIQATYGWSAWGCARNVYHWA